MNSESDNTDTTPAPAFFERYFAICRKYERRLDLQNKLRLDRIQEEGVPKARQLENKWGRELAAAEEMFWNSPPDVQATAFAEYARRFELDRFSQRVVLFLLYCELMYSDSFNLTPGQLAGLLELDGMVTARLQLLRRFSPDAVLMKNRVLCKDRHRQRGYVTLAPGQIDRLSLLAEGIQLEKQTDCQPDEASDEERDNELPERVGSVREPTVTLDDVVLPAVVRERLLFFLDQHRDGILEKRGITRHFPNSSGLALLFYGPPGTGKSMLAEAVAARLGREVLHVEVPKIMSRWVGGTDKQIACAFAAAKEHNLVLLFDEADSLLTRREMLQQDHDIRFVNDMLSAIEKYEGTVILTTNMDTLLDPAVERRLAMRVKFEQPTTEQREAIWRKHVQMDVPQDDDIDCARLAREYEFSGGYVRNAVLTAVRKMIADKRETLTMADLVFGAEFERDGMFVKEQQRKRITGFTVPQPAITATAGRK